MKKKLLFSCLLAMLAVTPIQKSEAVTIFDANFKCWCKETTEYNPDGTVKKKTIEYLIDPENVQSFQFDFKFDPAEEEFISIDYLDPYFESSPPDLSQLSTGNILNISGETVPADIPEGNVNLVALNFRPLVDNPSSVASLVINDNSYLKVLDTDSGALTTFTSDDLSSETCVPEPFTILGSVAIGTAGILHKRFKYGSSSS